jgi:hypothetical protein
MEESPLAEYKGSLVHDSVTIAHPNPMSGSHSKPVYSAKTRSPLVEIIRIEGQRFAGKQAAIQHGLELARTMGR